MKKLFQLLLIVLLGLGLLAPVATEAKEAFDIITHDVDITVNEDGTFDVIEEMSVTFSARRHGIYVNIPSEYHMTWLKDGEEISKYYRFPITNVKILSSHDREIDHHDSYTRIRFGSEDRYADKQETYKWSYTINTRDLDLDGVEMVFLNIITNGWNTSTDATHFTLRLPKSFDAGKIYTSTPGGEMLQGIGELDGVRISVDGNVITGVCEERIESNESITIQVILDQGYFNFPDINRYGKIAIIISAFFTMAVGIVFLIYGRDKEVIRTVEFHVPAGMTSAEVGTVIDEEVNDRDVISLLLDWGRRGIITIHETEKDLILEKRSELEDSARYYEKILFDRIFNRRDKVAVSALKNKIWNTVGLVKEKIEKYYSTKLRSLSTNISIVLQLILAALAFLPITLLTLLTYYFYYRDLFVLFMTIFQIIMLDTLMYLLIRIHKTRYIVDTWKWWQKLLAGAGLLMLLLIPAGMMFGVLLSAKVRITQGLAIMGIQISLMMFIMFMRQRTDYGNSELGRILGLRDFIRVADGDRLKELVEENPYYFYDILPYAYALGLTEIWTEHFKDLGVRDCDWYDSYRPYNDHYAMMHSLEYQMHNCQRSFASMPES